MQKPKHTAEQEHSKVGDAIEDIPNSTTTMRELHEGVAWDATNLAWEDAMAEVGYYFSKQDAISGWPMSFTTFQIAVLQRPHQLLDIPGIRQFLALLISLNKSCKKGVLTATIKKINPSSSSGPKDTPANNRRKWRDELKRGIGLGEDIVENFSSSLIGRSSKQYYFVTALDFKNWLQSNGKEPSEHIQAWFDAVIPAVQTVPNVPTPTAPAVTQVQRSAAQVAAILATLQTMGVETKEARQKRRYDLCIAAGLQMPSDDYSHLPRGIGALARAENISTAAFSKDVKAHVA